MAGFIAVPGCLKVEVIQDMAGVPVVNVIHMRYPGTTGTSSDLDAVASDIFDTWGLTFMTALNVDLVLGEVIVTDLASIASPQGHRTGSVAGSDATDALSSNAAAVISWHEAIRYRGGHPRTYLGGISQDELLTPKTFTSGFVVELENAASTFLTDVNTISHGAYGALKMTALHARMATTHPVPTPPVYLPPFMTDITGRGVDSRVDSQRRRLGR